MLKKISKKIFIFTTMALAFIVGAFSLFKANADSSLDDALFNGAKIYSWSINSSADVSSVVSYYQYYFYDAQNWSDVSTISISNNKVWLNSMNNTYHTLHVPYYYSLIIPNFNITTGFTLVNNTISVNDSLVVGVLYNDNSFEQFNTNGYITYFPVDNKEIKAIGYLNDTENLYAVNIFTGENDKLNSNLYYQGYTEGFNDGYTEGQAYSDSVYADLIDSKDAYIAELEEELLSDDRINFKFYDLLNNIMKFPLKLVHRVFYNETPVLDSNGDPVVDSFGNVQYESTTPIELFGVPIFGVIVGVFAIGLTVTIIAVIKKVWK